MSDIGTYAESLYQQVLPLHGPDPHGLAHDFVGAVAHPMREIDELVRDTPEGVGWSIIVDVDDAPVKGLWWLAQLAGVQLRQRKSVPARIGGIPNSNGETAYTVGWGTRLDPADGTETATLSLTAGHLAGAGGFSSHLTTPFASAGTWVVFESTSPSGMAVAIPGTLVGLTVSLFVTDLLEDAPGSRFEVDLLFFDRSFGLVATVGSAGVSVLPSDEYSVGDLITITDGAHVNVPPGAAYAGLRVRLPGMGTGAALDSRIDVGEANIMQVQSLEDTVAWPFSTPLRLETDDEWAAYARDAIKRQGGKHRGKPDSILSAAQDTLTGTRTARLRERVGGNAYALTLVTRPSETPDADATLAAANTMKPAGMKILHALTEDLLIDEDTGTIDTATGTIDVPT